MKKIILLVVNVLLLGLAGNAIALTSYDQTYSFTDHSKVVNGKDPVEFSFNNIQGQFSNSAAAVPTLLLTVPQGAKNFTDALVLKLNGTVLGYITKDSTSFSFSGLALDKLNAAIADNSVLFQLAYVNGGAATFTSARLSGALNAPVAPEPASMALVAAGLGALPFARKLRNSNRKNC